MIRRLFTTLRALAGNGRPDDIEALIRATQPTLDHVADAPDDYGYERTPIGDAAWLASIQKACRIEVACDRFRDELAEADSADDLIYLMGGDA